MSLFENTTSIKNWCTCIGITSCIALYLLSANTKKPSTGIADTVTAQQPRIDLTKTAPPQVAIKNSLTDVEHAPIQKANTLDAQGLDHKDSHDTELKAQSDNSESNEPLDWFARISLKESFNNSAINQHTLDIATIFQTKFSDSLDDLASHYRHIETDLTNAQIDHSAASEFLDFYRHYTEFEIEQSNDPHPLWLENPETIDDAIRLNQEKQQYRHTVFGQSIADQVWGHELKNFEYSISAMKILRDENYGSDLAIKEQLISELHAQTWSENELNPSEIQNKQFYTKLVTHGETLLNMTDERRNEKINEFKSSIYQTEHVEHQMQPGTESEAET